MTPAGNYYDKFAAKNPLVRYMMRGFRQSIAELMTGVEYSTLLEVGCGEGYILDLLRPVRAWGLDLDLPILQEARRRYPTAGYMVADGGGLPLPNKSFDVLLGIEVMEHVPDPAAFLREARRVARRHCLFSVPREPLWRVLNLARGRYWRDLGNTPGHINHWGAADFVALLGGAGLRVVAVRQPLPWTMVLCEV